MREIIRRERQIELALEGIRYHDLRRWKLAKSTYNNTFVRGWSIDQENTEDYYVVRNIAQKKYSQKDYLWPVKYDDKKGEHYYEEILYTNQFIHIPINGM